MSLSKYESNKRLIEGIKSSICNGSVFHAYIIEGDGMSDKESFAKDLCKAILCANMQGIGCDSCITCQKIEHGNYEDLHIVEADGMSVKDEQISMLQSELNKKPIGPRNIAIIKDADTMTPRAQNRLLKTLEEPHEGTIIILLSENRENLLDTIKSRCVIYRFEVAKENSVMQESADVIFEALSSDESFFSIRQLLTKYMKTREDAFLILDGLERIYGNFLTYSDPRCKLYKKEDIFKAIELIEEARRDLYAKVNYQYAIKNLLLKIGG